jgi:tRNA A37 threonylcarbamoyladenosine dehydratase
MNAFSYEQAFSRNIGWVTPAEQQVLRGKRVAIAGGGGVGGVHLLTLARLGVAPSISPISTPSTSSISTARSAP